MNYDKLYQFMKLSRLTEDRFLLVSDNRAALFPRISISLMYFQLLSFVPLENLPTDPILNASPC